VGRITKGFNKSAKAAGFWIAYDKTFHALRHSFATYTAFSGDMNMATLKSVMGHKDMKTTEGYSSEDYRFAVSQGASAW